MYLAVVFLLSDLVVVFMAVYVLPRRVLSCVGPSSVCYMFEEMLCIFSALGDVLSFLSFFFCGRNLKGEVSGGAFFFF